MYHQKIVAFTFTTYATDELKQRLGSFPLLTIKTMHSVFFDILKLADYKSDYLESSILMDYAKEAMISKILTERKILG